VRCRKETVVVSLRSAGGILFISSLMVVTVASCSDSTPAPSEGTVMGLASPCVGPVSGSNLRDFEYTISISKGSRTVAQQTYRGENTVRYRFDVPAGHYRVHNPPGTVEVTVRAGHVTHANLYEPCG
jgi:hypothetical protein